MNTWLHRYCIVLATATFLLVIAGTLVSGSGFERGHRVIASSVGLLTIGLVVWLWRAEQRKWLQWLGFAALLLVILQGGLGALNLRYGLPASSTILHACLAQIYFALAFSMVRFTGRQWEEAPEPIADTGRPALHHLAAALPVAVLIQVALGAGYRHGALGLMPHVVGALVVAGLVLMVAIIVLAQYRAHKAIAKPAKTLLLITLHQVPLGVLVYFLRITLEGNSRYAPAVVFATTAHVAVGALMAGWSVLVALEVARAGWTSQRKG